jgi:27-O-demethylrifamycin SV methyltransferase
VSAPIRDAAASHYDAITAGWQLIFGAHFHFGLFDAAAGGRLEGATESLVRALAAGARLTPELRVLDIGCGIGAPAQLLAATYGCRVHGLSTSAVGIEAAAARATSDRTTFAVADGAATGLPEASFDRVWIMESSHLFPDKPALLSEMHRVLRPGGRLALCDLVTLRLLPKMRSIANAKKFLAVDAAFGPCRTETASFYAEALEAAGFRNVEHVDVSTATQPTMAAWLQRIDERQAELEAVMAPRQIAVFRRAASVLEELFAQGVLGYAMVWADR